MWIMFCNRTYFLFPQIQKHVSGENKASQWHHRQTHKLLCKGVKDRLFMLNGGNYSQLGQLHVSTQAERMISFLFALLCAIGRICVDTFSILCFLWNCLSSHDVSLPAGYWYMSHCQSSTLWGRGLVSDPARFLFVILSGTEPELCTV